MQSKFAVRLRRQVPHRQRERSWRQDVSANARSSQRQIRFRQVGKQRPKKILYRNKEENKLTSEGSKVLERSGLRSSSSNNDGVLQGVVRLKGLDELSDGRTLLTDGNVDTVELLGLIVGGVDALLVEDSVKGDSSLTSLTITNDQLTLTTTDGNHGVDGLETSLDGLVDGTTRQDTRGLELSASLGLGVERTLSINGVTKSVNDTAQKLRTNRDVDL